MNHEDTKITKGIRVQIVLRGFVSFVVRMTGSR